MKFKDYRIGQLLGKWSGKLTEKDSLINAFIPEPKLEESKEINLEFLTQIALDACTSKVSLEPRVFSIPLWIMLDYTKNWNKEQMLDLLTKSKIQFYGNSEQFDKLQERIKDLGIDLETLTQLEKE